MDIYSSTASFFPPPDPMIQLTNALSAELNGLFRVVHISRSGADQIVFSGRLLSDAERNFDEIHRRFAVYGYTPMVREGKEEDVLIAVHGLIDRASTGNPLLNVFLLGLTVLTTLAAGATLAGNGIMRALATGSLRAVVQAFGQGAPFAITLLGILGIHELGHYVAARWHGVAATLPYFIPMPFGGLGTLGAFIAIKSPMRNRKVLFDIGLSGPMAGFVVALPLLVVGLLLSREVPYWTRGLTLRNAGTSVLVESAIALFRPVPAGRTLQMHPVFFASWFGLLITGINLLPVGQLDGGHVAYALFGRTAHLIALATFALLLLGGWLLSWNWFVWAFFVLLGGLKHPPPLNDVAVLDPTRRLLGWFSILLFFIVMVPAPFGR